jgi:chromosome segregation ATPase
VHLIEEQSAEQDKLIAELEENFQQASDEMDLMTREKESAESKVQELQDSKYHVEEKWRDAKAELDTKIAELHKMKVSTANFKLYYN